MAKLRVVISEADTGVVNEIVEINVSDMVAAGHTIAEFVQDQHEYEEPSCPQEG